MSGPLVVAVANRKGGTGKTATAVHLAHVWHERGRRVLLVDADPQGTALAWTGEAPSPFPFAVMACPSRTIWKQVPDIARGRYDVVVIDTPPRAETTPAADQGKGGQGIVIGALRIASVVVCPVAPTPSDVRELDAVSQWADDVSGLRPDGEPVAVAVLLTRVRGGTVSAQVWREQIESSGLWVLKSQVALLERFAQADGDNVINAAATAYGDVVNELEARGYVA